MEWNYNEWKNDKRWDDHEAATVEALRVIAEQLAQLNIIVLNALKEREGVKILSHRS